MAALAAGLAAKQGGGATPQSPTSIPAEVNGYYTPIATNIDRSAAMVPAGDVHVAADAGSAIVRAPLCAHH